MFKTITALLIAFACRVHNHTHLLVFCDIMIQIRYLYLCNFYLIVFYAILYVGI